MTMEKKWNWCAIWAGVAAIATTCAVGVAAWIGYNANEIAKQGKQLAEDTLKVSQISAKIAEESKKVSDRSLTSMEEFNKVQMGMMEANAIKMQYDIMNSEKVIYCEEILRRFCREFYVLSDKSDAELRNLGLIEFRHGLFEKNEFAQRYGIYDCDERIVLADFLGHFNSAKSERLGIYSVADAFYYYCNAIRTFGVMLYKLGGNEKEVEASQESLLQRIHPCFLSCADHSLLPLGEREGQRKLFLRYFENLEQIHQGMLNEREKERDYIKKMVKRLKKSPDTQNFVYWNAYLNFINKNDKRGKKDPYPVAVKPGDSTPEAGKKEKPADKPAVKTGKKEQTKRRK